MAISLTWGPSAIGALSGALYALLGLLLALPRPRRAHTLAFGAFCFLWGCLLFTGNVSGLVTTAAETRTWTFLYVAFSIVAYVPLAYFAALYPRRNALSTTLGAFLLLLPAAAGAVVLLVTPDLFHGEFRAGVENWGPLYPLYVSLFFAAFCYALLVLDRHRRARVTGVESRRASYVIAALVLYVGYRSSHDLLYFGAPLVGGPPSGVKESLDIVFAALGVAGLVVVSIIGWRAFRGPFEPTRTVVLTSVVVSTLAGFVGAVSSVAGGPTFLDSPGLFRTASVALIAYAILRYELFDIDAKVKRGAIVAGILVLAGVIAIAFEQGVERVVGSTGIAITLTQMALVGGVALVVVRSPNVARRLGARVLPSLDAPDRLDARRLEVYEAALAQAQATGGLDASAPYLADMRARLGVSDAEHKILARVVAGGSAPAAAAPARLEAGARVAGRYRLERLLGEGSAGAAWLARDETLARAVVLKALHARFARNEAAERAFLREARLAAGLDHPNVVRVFDFGYSAETPFLVMELVTGGSLEERLQAGPMPPAEARRVTVDVLRGLAHVHARGVLHRDLKPANVLLAADGTAKISDFGVALPEGADDTHTGLEPPAPKGTPATMSPEAVRGLALSPRSDLYSAGAILYRLATGRAYLAMDGRTRESLRAAILSEVPLPATAGSDATLVAIAFRALEKEPSRRFASADEMLAAIEPGALAR